MKSRIILASQSIGRKKLLEYLKVPFEIVHSTLDEEKIVGPSPIETIRMRARTKGDDVVKQKTYNPPIKLRARIEHKTKNNKPTTHHPLHITIILSADSGAILDGKLIGKPKDEKDAYRIFRFLSGRTHEFVTATYIVAVASKPGVELAAKKVLLDDVDRSYVTFRTMTDEDIKLYLKLTDYTKYAGGYAVSSAQNFITKIEGSISNVIGLPLEKVIPILRKKNLL